MPSFRDERRVRHRAEQMFALVADVERYPEFVPLCKALKVRSRRIDDQGRETLVAGMTVGYKLIRETFTSRVMLDKPAAQCQGRICRRSVQPSGKHLELPRRARQRGLAHRLLHRLRVQEPHPRRADGLDVRRRVPQVRACVRGTRERGLRTGVAAARRARQAASAASEGMVLLRRRPCDCARERRSGCSVRSDCA